MEALYFPHLSLPPSTWVNPALLFFDRLRLISPDGGDPTLYDDRTRELIDLGMAGKAVPRGGWGQSDDSAFISYVLGRASVARAGRSMARIHLGKLSYGRLPDVLLEAQLLHRAEGFWLEGPEWVIDHMMSYLAFQLSRQSSNRLPLVSDERASAIPIRKQNVRAMSRRLISVTSLLPVPPDANPKDLEKFRRRHRDELETFRTYVNSLIGADPRTQAGDARFQDRLREAQRVRDHLVNEMATFNWRDFGPTLVVSLATTAAPFIEEAPWSATAAAIGAGMAAGQAMASFRRRRRALDSPLIYATRALGRWAPKAEQTLR